MLDNIRTFLYIMWLGLRIVVPTILAAYLFFITVYAFTWTLLIFGGLALTFGAGLLVYINRK